MITGEAVEACEMLEKQGKTRFIGISAHDINAVVDKILKIRKFDVVQTTYSYAIGSHFRYLDQTCNKIAFESPEKLT